MREFVCRPNTKFAGIHPIYDSYEEFRIAQPIAKLWKWGQELIVDSVVGDWFQAEDGYIVQLLQKYDMHNKAKVTYVTCYRFPMGTFGVTKRVDGSIRYPLFYAQFTMGIKGRLATNSYDGLNTSQYAKVRFAAMVMAGADPRTAYKSCMPAGKRFLTRTQLEKKIMRLFMDPVVGKEIKQHVKAFKDELAQKITLNDIIEKIQNHWKNVKPGSSQELAAINFAMEFHDVVVTDEATGKKKMINKGDEVQEDYELEDSTPFPALGPKED